MKNILKKYSAGILFSALVLMGILFSLPKGVVADVTSTLWLKQSNGQLYTNSGNGAGNAIINVAGCNGCGGGGGGGVTNIATADSITGGPITATGTILLVGDSATPGNSRYYGTNGSGTKGFFLLPDTGVTSVICGSLLTCSPGSPITATGTITISPTTVVPGTYTNATISVTSTGQIISASSGSGGGTIAGSIANTQIPFGTGTNTIGGSALLTWTPSPSTITPAVLSVLNGAGNPFFVADSTLRKVSLGDSTNAVNGTKLIVDDGVPIITAGIGTKNYLSLEANIQSFGDTTGNAFLESVPVSSALSAFVGGVQALKLDGSALQYSLGNLSGTLATVDDTAHTITLNATSGVVIPHAAVKISGLAYTFPSSFGSVGSVLTDTSGSGSLSWLPAGAGSVSIGSPIGSSTAPNILFIGSGGLLAQDNNFTYNSPSNVFNVGFAGNSFLSINHATNTYAMGAISAGSGNQTNISVNDTNQTFTLSSSSGMASLVVPQTITSPTTTGSVTINKMSGSVNFGVGMSSLSLSDSLVTPNSDVQCTIGTVDPVMFGIQCIPGAGNVNMIVNSSPVSTAKVNFFITN